MALYFNERGLHYEDGSIFLISYHKILQECLKGPFKTVSISAIIFETVGKMTGMKVIKKNYNQSPVYRWLEKRIREDPSYMTAKYYKLERDRVYRQFKKEYEKKRKNQRGFNETLNYIEKRRMQLRAYASNRTKEY